MNPYANRADCLTGQRAEGDGEPVNPAERIVAIDALRGVAVLGILVMNIQAFSMVEAAYLNPTAYGDLNDANLVVWVLGHVLVDQKFMAIFSMLFGAGIVLMAERAESRGRASPGIHYRRMAWLILFGILHAHLLWFGDILFVYGVCGLMVYLLRGLPPRWLLALGLTSLAVVSVLWLLFGWSMQFWDQASMDDFAADWQPGAERVAEEVAIYQGGWIDQMPQRMRRALVFETLNLVLWTGWRAGGLMLIGMALYRRGVFSARCSHGYYLSLIGAALLAGIPAVLYGMHQQFERGWDGAYAFFFGSQFNHWASVLVALGWIGVVMLACTAERLAPVTRRLAAVGRMALTNYLMQSVICTLVFYGHGLGLFGRVPRTSQLAIVGALWALQLTVSPLWLRQFRFGPLEWLWRSLTYWRLQPMRR